MSVACLVDAEVEAVHVAHPIRRPHWLPSVTRRSMLKLVSAILMRVSLPSLTIIERKYVRVRSHGKEFSIRWWGQRHMREAVRVEREGGGRDLA
jgi:hypothetical protein